MSHAPDLSMAHTGDILGGRYILRERLGAGGMGRVFRARDEVLARDVAIKIFHAGAGDGSEPLRRMSEARALAALTHPSLVTLYDARLVGEDHVYLVMELIAGPSLQRRIEQEAIAPAEVAGILGDLAGALAVVHAAGIVHRDVKPSNVLLRPLYGAERTAEAVLADFGVARLVDATRLTTPGTVIGTAAYLSPEQVRGEAPQPASDVYALGLLAIEAVTRLHPFGAGTLQETLLARLARRPAVPSALSADWRALLDAMTATDARARPSAAEVATRAESLRTPSASLAAGHVGSPPTWMLPTTVMAAPTAAPPATVPADRAGPSTTAAATALGSSKTRRVAGPSSTVAAPTIFGISETRADAVAEHRVRPHRRRRGWAWITASAAAAVIACGALAAFSSGVAEETTSDRAPVPAVTPASESTTAPALSGDSPTPSAPVAGIGSPEVPTPQLSPSASTPAQVDAVVIQPATAVDPDAGAGATAPSEAPSGSTSPQRGTPPGRGAVAPDSAGRGTGGPTMDGTGAGDPGGGAPEGRGRPDSPGSPGPGADRGAGPKQKERRCRRC